MDENFIESDKEISHLSPYKYVVHNSIKAHNKRNALDKKHIWSSKA